jgi:hypothetical protein
MNQIRTLAKSQFLSVSTDSSRYHAKHSTIFNVLLQRNVNKFGQRDNNVQQLFFGFYIVGRGKALIPTRLYITRTLIRIVLGFN